MEDNDKIAEDELIRVRMEKEKADKLLLNLEAWVISCSILLFVTLAMIASFCQMANIVRLLIIVPALAVDKNNYRLGYGKGFYDRFLNDFNRIKVVCIPKCLTIDTIYPEKHDIPMDLVITD